MDHKKDPKFAELRKSAKKGIFEIDLKHLSAGRDSINPDAAGAVKWNLFTTVFHQQLKNIA